jgi:capsular polysaccharide biosynthesis protein
VIIPAAVRHSLAERLERDRREHFPDLETLVVRFRGDVAYVARDLGDGATEPLLRLSWKGSQDDWGVAVWSEPEQSYLYVTLSNGDAGGTPEDALRRAYETGPGRQANGRLRAARWSLPAPDQPKSNVVRPYLRAVRAHPVLVVLVVLAAALGSAAIVLLRSPTYTAQARLLVTPVERGEAGDLGLPLLQEHGDPTRTIETAAAVVENREIAAATADDLGGGWTAEEVLDAIDVMPRGQTNVLDVRATADDAETAAALANAYADAVIRIRDDALRQSADEAIAAIESDLAASDTMSSSTVRTLQSRLSELELVRLTGDPTVAVAESAEAPLSPDGSPTFVVVIAALMVGLLLAPGAALVVELLGRRRLMDEDEVAEVYPLAVLARVPVRRGVVASPGTDPDVRDAFRRLCAQIEIAQPRPRTIMITSPSDDNGRTSSSLNLAAELADDGSTKVVLIDLDGGLVGSAAATGIVEEAGRVAGFSRYQLRKRDSLLVLSGRNLDRGSADRAVDAAFEAIRLTADVADYVVFHAPPLAQMTDVLRLAATADALILVIHLGATSRKRLEAARAQLESIGIQPTGYVAIGASG